MGHTVAVSQRGRPYGPSLEAPITTQALNRCADAAAHGRYGASGGQRQAPQRACFAGTHV
jgi:hypothetical protein